MSYCASNLLAGLKLGNFVMLLVKGMHFSAKQIEIT